MIEKMKKVTVLAEGSRKQELLLSLREEGVMHISDLVMKTQRLDEMEKERGEYVRIRQMLIERGDKKDKRKLVVEGKDFERLHQAILKDTEDEERLKFRLVELKNERDRIRGLGDFDPDAVRRLADDGIPLYLYTIGKKEEERLRERDDIFYIPVKYDGKAKAIAVLYDKLPSDAGASEIALPESSLASIEAEILSDEKELAEIGKRICEAGCYVPAYDAFLKKEDERITLERVSSTIAGSDIIYLSGYIPEYAEKRFRKHAESNAWAYMIDDPGDDDNPPTLVKYKGFTRIIKPIFDILGTVPGYHEYDISSYFLLFFALFFAMIIGDAGYGLVFLIIAILMHVKSKKPSDVNILLYVLSVVTIIWGTLTGTWFGSEAVLEALPFLKIPIIPAITNFPAVVGVDPVWAQNMLMKFCCILGAVQLGLARVINIITKAKNRDISLIAEAGWFIDVVMLYLMALYLVIGEAVPFNLIIGGIVTGFILVCVFSGQGPGISFIAGLKAGLAGFFTTFLDTISCFSNIMSYIRLFAVGMASLAIAQSFNGMAGGMLHGALIPVGILIIVLGHALNLVMGMLSVVVHGIRLNLLEFSGALGMEWSGYNYEPFRKMVNDKAAENS